MKVRSHIAIPIAVLLLALAHGARPRFSRIGPSELYPDPAMTPGATNPDITQRNIQETICNRKWSTKLIRPAREHTSKLKRKQLRDYGDTVH